MSRRAGPGSGRGGPDIELDISNFGPIEKGRIALRPLTILVGPNNSGKTYASVLAHSVISSCADLARAARSGDWAGLLLEDGGFQGLSARADRLAGSGSGKDGAAVTPALHSRIHDSTVGRLFAASLFTRLRHNFGSPPGGLVRAGSRSSRIRIRGPISADVSIARAGAPAVRVARGGASRPGPAPAAAGSRGGGRRARPGRTGGRRGSTALLELAAKIAGDASASVPPGASHYLPAARSGVMCAHGALAPGILDEMRRGGAGTAGTVSDLADSLARPCAPPRNGTRNAGARIIPDVLGGRLDTGGDGALSYSRAGTSVPMHMSSSGIAGTAPLALAASAMRPGDTLIVEEPEAHLHPRSQAALATRMAGLVRQGMRVILSTHSAFFLAQMSMLVRAGTLASSGRRIPGLGRHDYVTDDEVAPYLFRERAGGGHEISEMEHSGKEGISQDEFVKVAESMSDEDFRIDGALGD